MTLYYIKQDNSISGCGEPGCCGENYEDIEKSFLNCDCLPADEMTADHLQVCKGGGPVLKWRKATDREILAYAAGNGDGHEEGYFIGVKNGKARERERIIKLLEEHVHDTACTEADGSHAYQAGFEHAIALIKGENK